MRLFWLAAAVFALPFAVRLAVELSEWLAMTRLLRNEELQFPEDFKRRQAADGE